MIAARLFIALGCLAAGAFAGFCFYAGCDMLRDALRRDSWLSPGARFPTFCMGIVFLCIACAVCVGLFLTIFGA